MIQRAARLQPWYHVPLPRCDALIGRDEDRCIFSARYEDKKGRVKLCKTHRDMVDIPMRLIQQTRAILRAE